MIYENCVHEFVRDWGMWPDTLFLSEKNRIVETRVRLDYHPSAGPEPVLIFTHLIERVL